MKVRIEVERKDGHDEEDTGGICWRLFGRGFQAHPVKQKQYYLSSTDPKVNERVRKETKPSGVTTFTHTVKTKCEKGDNTNHEDEKSIDKATFKRLKATRQLTVFGIRVWVKKKRVHFYGTYAGYEVTVCLDHAWGPLGIELGRFVEFETMVDTQEEVEAAEAVLAELSREIMPAGSKREWRGYKTLALLAIAKLVRRQRKKAKGKK